MIYWFVTSLRKKKYVIDLIYLGNVGKLVLFWLGFELVTFEIIGLFGKTLSAHVLRRSD